MEWRHRRILLVALLPLACSENDLGIEKRRPNLPPQTILSGGPSDGSSDTPYRVELSWWGSDPDGSIDHYDVILIDHAAAVDSAGFSVTVPAIDDPRWIGTFSTDSLFVTSADTLRRDPLPGEEETPPDVLDQPFERWHSFFVRAVDNEGLTDPTPDYVSFNSVNLAPTVSIRPPVKPGFPFDAPPTLFITWDGQDPVGNGDMRRPAASRWVLIPSGIDADVGYTSWPDSLYRLPTRFAWTPWQRWDAADSSGVHALIQGLRSIGPDPNSGHYIFAVQAVDEAGAITPVFDTKTPNKNNAVLIRVSRESGPRLLVEDRFLGVYNLLGEARPVQLEVAAGQPIRFRWSADASQYGGRIVGYRFGWNLRNPQDDSEWQQGWSASALEAPARTFFVGTHRFYLQARDNADNITSVVFELATHELTLERDLLWVDDTVPVDPRSRQEAEEDARWREVFTRTASQRGFSFDPVSDVYDVESLRRSPPPIDLAFRYKVIVWSVRNGSGGRSGLRSLAQFVDPFAERNRLEIGAFNYLTSYMRNGGKLWINGFRPALQVWPSERVRGRELDPVNVTHWDDPIEPHPHVDSAGTTSLLYLMGVEMFDVGAATGAARRTVAHFCEGLARANGIERQPFESSVELAHTHLFELATSEVELPPAAGVDRETSDESAHRHHVHLSSDKLATLQRGESLQVLTSPSSFPEAHSHALELRDQVGAWGAPPLVTGARWGFRTGDPGRANVEIYNMPNAMANELPPLLPPQGISTALYTYVSGTPADGSTGLVYPRTADAQPVFILAKNSPLDPFFTRAFCGFEPHLLLSFSHEQLVDFILVRHFRLGSASD
ncbi:MAG: hypothetical protein JSW67_00580 [Candidatus Latescibacterota bacterium]|nr:MAG: hypothetical protein JSW67_00580 [Candidatus Latescibacterota bacterium]